MRGLRQMIQIVSLVCALLPARVAVAQSKAYSLDDIVDLMKGGVPSASILSKTKGSCIGFHVTAGASAKLRNAGASDALLAGLATACYKGEGAPATSVGIPPRPRVSPVKILVHDTVMVRDTVRVRDTVLLRDTVRLRDTVVATPPAPVVPLTVTLAEGSEVVAVLGEELSSKEAKLGDRVNMAVAEDVIVERHIVIAKGTAITAEVAEVKGAGRMGRGGKLTVRLTGTTSVDQQPVHLRGSKAVKGGGHLTSALALSVFGAGLFRHGNDITLKAGSLFPIFVDQPLSITPDK